MQELRRRPTPRRWMLITFTTLFCGWLNLYASGLTPLAEAGEIPTEPILRIETGMHMARIMSIGVDAKEQILVSGSRDKTVRVWELRSGRLLRVLRTPIDTAEDGRILAVAISPDGRTVAAGGLTGWNWDGSISIYLFDVETGNMVRKLSGLPEAVWHLAYSKDGRYLAATLAANGLRVYETSAWSLKAKDAQYDAGSDWADFDGEGRLVTTCRDGFIRLYDKDFHLLSKKQLPGGDNVPRGAAFSQDGSKIAVGFTYSTKVGVFSGRDLSFLHSPDTSGVSGRLSSSYGILDSVAWSADGRMLYAGGQGFADGEKGSCPIRTWTQEGKGAFQDHYTFDGHQCSRIGQVVALRQGGIAFTSDGPWSIGVIGSDGKKSLSLTPSNPEYRGSEDGILVSMNGSTVQFGLEVLNKRLASFSVTSRTLSPLSSKGVTPPGLVGPLTRSSKFSVTDWWGYMHPKVNGVPLNVPEFTRSRCFAVSPDEDSFVIGTDFHLGRFNRNGGLKWKTSIPGLPFGVNISGDGRLLVAPLEDGTIRWYRMEDGQELLALFPHKDGRRWVVWTPSGYYACSPGADELIGWHVNNGKDKSPDFYPVSRFRSVYYRPDVIERVLATLDGKEALKIADQDAGRKPQEVDVQKMLPPVVTLHSPKNGAEVSSTLVKVNYEVRSPSGEPVSVVKVLVDGRPASDPRGVESVVKDQPSLPIQGGLAETTVFIPERDCNISIIAENRYAASVPGTLQVRWAGKRAPTGKSAAVPESAVGPKLYVLAVGVGQYQNPSLRLTYPAKDATDFAGTLGTQKTKLYRDVASKVLIDGQATRDGVIEGLEWIERESTSKDVAMVFLAGHGMDDRNGDYYFLPKDADTGSLMRTGIPYSTLKKVVTRLPGQVLFFVDTCHSGDVMGDRRRGVMADIDKVVNDLAAPENGIVVFASSTGTQYSLESDLWANGAFTKALVEGLSGKADYSGKGRITMNMLNLYLSERVKELTDGKQTPTTSIPKIMPDFTLAVK